MNRQAASKLMTAGATIAIGNLLVVLFVLVFTQAPPPTWMAYPLLLGVTAMAAATLFGK